MHRISITEACGQASEVDDIDDIERIIHAALVEKGVPTKRVAELKEPIAFAGPGDYLAHIKEALAPEYDVGLLRHEHRQGEQK